ncbi:hypothetical protein ACHJH3_06010 [Campylobacter sp. MOP7]|uniref:hypothetical protein n=1 Tax=Campylobacter canis TaxID=3378588 RepID=UPI00387E3CF4
MADGNIAISQDAVLLVLKKLRLLIEESGDLQSQVKRAISDAEAMGWKDFSYLKFQEHSEDLLRKYNETIREMEDTLVRDLVNLNNSIEGF